MLYRALFGACWLLLGPLVAAEPVSYNSEIQPIFTRYCVACHACYDSPCQLNLGSGEGVERGANKLPVYDGMRIKAQATTCLFLDAHDSAAWRRRAFFSVLDQQGNQAALMARILELGRGTPLIASSKLPGHRQ